MYRWKDQKSARRTVTGLGMLVALFLAMFSSGSWASSERITQAAAANHSSATQQQLAELMQLSITDEARPGDDLQCERAGQLVRRHFLNSTTYDAAFASFPSMRPYADTQEPLCLCLIKAMVARVDKDSSLQWLVADYPRYTGQKPGLVLALLDTLYDELYPFEHVLWGPEAHEALRQLSANNTLGNHNAGSVFSVREYAWILRMEIFGDQMPEADALTMDAWRTETMLKVYNRYYVYAWLALVPLALLFLKYGRSPKTQCFATLAYPIPLVGVLFVLSVIASIGHNYANSSGMLYVWRLGFWIFFGTLVLAYLFGLRSLWRTRSGRPAGRALE